MELKFVHIDEGEFMPNKTKIFFSCHPDDMKYFKEISKDILELAYCFLYYAEEYGKPLDEEEWRFSLAEMSVMVVPITEKYLTQPNRAFDLDLKIARENNILILPILCEDGIVDLFNKKFGEVQFLNKNSTDTTEVAYKDKLADFLKSAVKSHEHTIMAMQNFKGLIFLSYRKKDRKLAQELMREIHNNEELYDLCIWYDEFLTPGERFNDEIAMLLQHSDLMILNVTPSIVEEGNYIIQVEYPNALALDKIVLPIEMQKTDRDKLNKNYEYMPNIVDISNKKEIVSIVKAALGSKFKSSFSKDKLEHKYYVALGYLDGLGVAKDRELGVKLMEECAASGYPQAIYELSQMYILGKGIKQDVQKGIELRNVLIDKAYKEAQAKNFTKQLVGVSQFLTEVSSILPVYYLMGIEEEANKLYEKVRELLAAVNTKRKKKKLPQKVEALYRVNLLKYCQTEGLNRFTKGEYQKALELYLEAAEHNDFRFREMWREANGAVPVNGERIQTLIALENYDSIGICYMHLKEFDKAESYLIKALEAFKIVLKSEEDGGQGTDAYIVRYNTLIATLGNLYTELKKFDKAEKLYKEAIRHQEMLISKQGDTFEDTLISLICRMAMMYVKVENFKEAETQLLRAKTILDRQLEKREKTLLLVQIGLYSEAMGDLCLKLNKNEEAMRHYQKAVIQYAKLRNNQQLDILDTKIKSCKGEN